MSDAELRERSLYQLYQYGNAVDMQAAERMETDALVAYAGDVMRELSRVENERRTKELAAAIARGIGSMARASGDHDVLAAVEACRPIDVDAPVDVVLAVLAEDWGPIAEGQRHRMPAPFQRAADAQGLSVVDAMLAHGDPQVAAMCMCVIL